MLRALGPLVASGDTVLLRAIALELAPGVPLVIDVTGVEVIDGDGIRALELAARKAQGASCRFALAASPEVAQALAGRFETYPDRAAACAAVAPT